MCLVFKDTIFGNYHKVATKTSLPEGWRQVASQSRVGAVAYENIYTKQRQADVPTDPALKDATYAITSGINVTGHQRSLMLTQVWSDEFTSALHSYVDA